MARNGGWDQGADHVDWKFDRGIAEKPHLLEHSASQAKKLVSKSAVSDKRPGMGADHPAAGAPLKVKKLAKMPVNGHGLLIVQNPEVIVQLDDEPRLQLDFAAVLELAARAAGARTVARVRHLPRHGPSRTA